MDISTVSGFPWDFAAWVLCSVVGTAGFVRYFVRSSAADYAASNATSTESE